MADGGNNFDFTSRNEYGLEDFNKSLVRGAGDLRHVVESELVEGGEAYLACLLGLSRDR